MRRRPALSLPTRQSFAARLQFESSSPHATVAPRRPRPRPHSFRDNSWTQIYQLGKNEPQAGVSDPPPVNPGKRVRFSLIGDGIVMYMFGGFRLWQGFAPENSQHNNWEDYNTYAKGGYLDDLWMYDKAEGSWQNYSKQESCYEDPGKAWAQRDKARCTVHWPTGRAGHVSVLDRDLFYVHGGFRTYFPYPNTHSEGSLAGVSSSGVNGFTPFPTHPFYLDDMWRFNLTSGFWVNLKPFSKKSPAARMSHIMVLSGIHLIVFGGYRSNFHFGDTWHYNITSNRWIEQTQFVHAYYPAACTDDLAHRQVRGEKMDAEWHSGQYKEDTKWIRRSASAHCASRVVAPSRRRAVRLGPCWSARSRSWIVAHRVHSNARRESSGTPSASRPPLQMQLRVYYPLHANAAQTDHDCPQPRPPPPPLPSSCMLLLPSHPHCCALLHVFLLHVFLLHVFFSRVLPHAVPSRSLPEGVFSLQETDTQLYAAQRRFFFIDENHYGAGEVCQQFDKAGVCQKWAGYSVVAEPTRDAAMLPRFANITLMMRQPRRQAPGWDGCRDRTDGRDWLPNQLLWKAPKQRSDFSAVFSEKFKVLLFYGGFGYKDLTPHLNNVTEPSSTMGDLWQYHIANCVKNCSLHGDCVMGMCYCHDGCVCRLCNVIAISRLRHA
jgi:hypothetical protein